MTAPSAAATILIVDDATENLLALSGVLQPQYRVRAAISGARALQILEQPPLPDLILLDIMMPELDGYGVLRRIRANPATASIPVIFVTALEAAPDEALGLGMGAVDYIGKPFVPAVVLARVRTHLELKQARDRLQDRTRALEDEVAQRMRENRQIQQAGIRALAHLAEIRDPETPGHLRRIQAYVRILATGLRDQPRFVALKDPAALERIVEAAPLHDIGKVGIPDHILFKPGRLGDAEWVVMKTHAALGSDAIAKAEDDAGQAVPFLQAAREIARWHHERWDGKGYPDGLSADMIPIGARLMALADVFDALVSPRVYKPAMKPEFAIELLREGRGTQFDPDVVDAFLARREALVDIAMRHGDTVQEVAARMPPPDNAS